MERKTIAILGATGSIGTQTLDIISRYPDRFRAVCLCADSSSEAMFELVRRFRPLCASLNRKPAFIPEDVRSCEWFFGKNSAAEALAASKAQYALCAIVGIAGLDAVWRALDVCERILLANKEALVTGGDLVMRKAAEKHIPILPVDSEHSAIFQCLQAAQGNPVRQLILTCSGGALRNCDRDSIYNATVHEVLAHPTWKMGDKITVDCASLMNKGLEVIEAHHLFAMPAQRIDVVIHPQSIVHSMLEFEDGSVLAQMAEPDMRGPISYAMGFPERLPHDARRLDLTTVSRLDFSEPDRERFPCLGIAVEALKAGGGAAVVLNGANEVAVRAFLNEEISFGRIPEIVRDTLNAVEQTQIGCIADVHRTDAQAREAASRLIRRIT